MTRQFLNKYLCLNQIESALLEIAALPDTAGVRVAVSGGIAMQVYGSDRLSMSIEFLADRIFDGINVQRALSFGGIVGLTVKSQIPVSVIVRNRGNRNDDSRHLYEEALDAAEPLQELCGALVVTPEYLAALKFNAGQVKDEEDLNFLIRNRVIDIPLTEDIIARLMGSYASRKFQSAVDEVEWKRERDRRRDS
jgi:hypothetical protein